MYRNELIYNGINSPGVLSFLVNKSIDFSPLIAKLWYFIMTSSNLYKTKI